MYDQNEEKQRKRNGCCSSEIWESRKERLKCKGFEVFWFALDTVAEGPDIYA